MCFPGDILGSPFLVQTAAAAAVVVVAAVAAVEDNTIEPMAQLL